MSYARKTRDIWVLQGNYGTYGWEDVGYNYSWLCAHENKRLYAVNMPEYPLRLIKRREKIDEPESQVLIIAEHVEYKPVKEKDTPCE